MCIGTIFDIKEFAIQDGPGLRTTVFLKGCPLRCPWCHNPEGLAAEPEILRSPAGERAVGERVAAAELAERLNRQIPVLRKAEGGVTFSGGEPLMQADFLLAVCARLDSVHVLLDTSGQGDGGDFARLLAVVDQVYFDLKLMDAAAHRRITGVDNGLILANLAVLAASGIPWTARVPLVPGVTDTAENLARIADHLAALPSPPPVHLLPYNRAAGGKYAACGRAFLPGCDESQPVHPHLDLFHSRQLETTLV